MLHVLTTTGLQAWSSIGPRSISVQTLQPGRMHVHWNTCTKHRSTSGQLAFQLSDTLLSQLALRLKLKHSHRVRSCAKLVSQLLHLVLQLLQEMNSKDDITTQPIARSLMWTAVTKEQLWHVGYLYCLAEHCLYVISKWAPATQRGLCASTDCLLCARFQESETAGRGSRCSGAQRRTR